MAELPSAKPIYDLTWSTAGTKNEPSGALKSSGFVFEGTIAYDETNWRWNAQGLIWPWIQGNVIRAFDTLESAIDGTVEGDMFRLVFDYQTFYQTPQTKTSKHGTGNAVETICCDGRLMYYVQNDDLVGAACDPGVSGEDWSLALASPASPALDSDCDGTIVAVGFDKGAGGEAAIVIANAVTGAQLYKNTTHVQILSVACVTDTTESAVFYAIGTGGIIYKWTSGAGQVIWLTMPGGDPINIRDICIGGGRMAVYYTVDEAGGDRERVNIYDLTSTTPLITFDVVTGATNNLLAMARMEFDEDGSLYVHTISAAASSDYLLRYRTDVIATKDLDIVLDTVAAPTSAMLSIAIDERNVYIASDDAIYAISKERRLSGASVTDSATIIWEWDLTSTATPAALVGDGRYVWTNVEIGQASPNYINGLNTGALTGLWLRQGDGSTAGSEFRVNKKLAVPR